MWNKIKHAWNNPMDALYFIQGCLHWVFYKVTGFIVNRQEYNRKLKGAKDCVDNGVCIECGCSMELVLLSSKPCPKRKTSPDKTTCY